MKKGLFFLALLLCLLPHLVIAQSNIEQEYQRWLKPFVDTAETGVKVTIPEGMTIEDNFFRVANEINIKGDVMGDVIVLANQLTIDGDVNGDVLAAAEAIEINGKVAGNVRVAAIQVEINNTVGKNVNILSGTATLSEKALVGWTLSFLAEEITINSPVGGNIYGYGNRVTIDNTVGNNVTLFFDEKGQVTLKSNTNIDGSFNYRGEKNAIIESGATIKGNTIHQLIPTDIVKTRKFLSQAWLYGKIISLFSLLLVGTLLISLFHQKSNALTKNLWPNPLPKMLWGLLLLFVIPIVIFIATITIIGIPLALIITSIYIFLIYISKIFIGLFIGQKILKTDKKQTPLIWTMMLGVLIYFILVNIPYVGWIISLVGTAWFFGAIWQMILSYKNIKKEKANENKPKNI